MKEPTNEQILAAARASLSDRLNDNFFRHVNESNEPVKVSIETEVLGSPGKKYRVEFFFTKTAGGANQTHRIIQ